MLRVFARSFLTAILPKAQTMHQIVKNLSVPIVEELSQPDIVKDNLEVALRKGVFFIGIIQHFFIIYVMTLGGTLRGYLIEFINEFAFE